MPTQELSVKIDTIDQLLEVLRDFQLLTPTQLTETSRILRRRFTAPLPLIRYLQQLGWLTAYHSDCLSKGQISGLTFQSYRLLDRLGEGGVGQVFKAKHSETGQIVALKILHEASLKNPEIFRRFQREMKIALGLNHPNVVRTYDGELSSEWGYLAMEYLVGTDLDRILRDQKRLAISLACEYIRQTALGLQHAFEAGLVHRDIKPANILIVPHQPGTNEPLCGTAKLLDLGLARGRSVEGNANQSVTLEGATLGTPDYMAPEQARNAKNVDIRADIYSLGCTLYQCLTGQVPFAGGTVISKLMRHQREQPAPVQRLNPEVPIELGVIVQRMLAKAPADRFSKPEEVANYLLPFSDLEEAA